MPVLELETRKIVARLEREGWMCRGGGGHDVFSHPARTVAIAVPRHRVQTYGTARQIAKKAGWI